MTPDSPIINELKPLLDALCEEMITPDELKRVEELVLNHPEAEAYYVRFIGFYADLISHVAGLPERAAGATAPEELPVAEPLPIEPAALPQPAAATKEKPMKRFRIRWQLATAALVLLGLGTLSAFQFSGWYRQSRAVAQAQHNLDESRAELARLQADQKSAEEAARKDITAAAAAQEKLARDFVATLEAARKAIEAKDFVVRLTGPAHIQPGAPNKWQIETLRHGAVGRPKKMEVVVKDDKDKELFRQTHDKPVGIATLELPASFWERVKPGADLFLEVAAFSDDDRRSVLAERLPLARPVFVTDLGTDKPLYKPGEVVRFRSLTLDRSTLRPPEHDLYLKFRLRDPGDAVVPLEEGNGRILAGLQPVLGPDKKPLRGIGVGEYTLAAEAPGGEYKLDLFEGDAGKETLLETRKFIVNRYVPDVFEKKLELDGKSYGPGDVVQARIEVSRTAGGPMKDARANVVAAAEGREFHKESGAKFTIQTAAGATKAILDVRFKLPADVFDKPVPNATLSVNIQDGSDAEPIVRPIPLVTKSLKVEFFPEGGEPIEGLPGRVYFQVRTPAGKPADLKGYITDGTDRIDVATLTDAENPGVNRGQGVFSLTPKAGAKYFLKLTSPTGIVEPTKDGFPLPEAKADGIALTALDAVTPKDGAIRVRVQVAKGTKTLHVGAYSRGRLIAHQKLEVAAAKASEVSLKGDDPAGGVTRITVFEEPQGEAQGRAQLIPRAERLVYRAPGESLILNAKPEKERYTPGGKVRLDLTAGNEKEAPAPAVLLVAVVNRSVITMADNKTDRLMPTHFLLSGDVKHPAELEHADFLLTEHPKAAVALDLLLGTQGWRRFAEQTGSPADAVDRAEVDRMLVAHGQRSSAPVELYKLEEQRIASEFQPKLEKALLDRAAAQSALSTATSTVDDGWAGKIKAAQTAVADAEKGETQAAADLYRYESRFAQPRSWGLPLLLVAFFGLSLGGAALAATRPGSRKPFLLASITLFIMGTATVGGVMLTRATTTSEMAWNKVNPTGPALASADTARESGQVLRNAGGAANAPNGHLDRGFDMLPMEQFGAPFIAPEDRAMPWMDARPRPGAAAPVAPAAGPPGPRDVAKFPERADDGAKLEPKAVLDAARRANPGRRGQAAQMAREIVTLRDRERIEVADLMKKARMGGGGFGGARGAGFAGEERLEMDRLAVDFETKLRHLTPFIVREYAHQRDSSLGDVRGDFTETVYWNPVLVLPESGKTSVEFQLSDDIARYQVLVAGHTVDGRIGAITKTIEARKPFSVDPKLPLEISHTDVVDVPVRITNDSDDRRTVGFTVAPSGLKIEGSARDDIELGANGKGRKVFRLKADQLQGDAGLVVEASSKTSDRDTIARSIRVVPDGFPGVGSVSDMIEKRASGSVRLPKDVVPGTLKMRLEVYPTSMADLVKGLDGLLREPSGCFEQTSTTNYPNTMILGYLNQTNQANPEAAKRAKELLERGLARLTSFECPDTPGKTKHGFEWFGAADMQHEALTAYGLLQFKDMARVHPVDPQLIKRTQAFLLSRKDGNGGFKQNSRALHSWGASKQVVNAYIVWALVESDPDDAERMDLKKEIDTLKREALDENSTGGKDAYFVALVANVLAQRGEREAAHRLLDRLQEKHMKDGRVTGAVTSVTNSGGRDLEIETTALSMLGWLRANDPKYATSVKVATKWSSQQRGGYGGFGSTQSTILALKALTLHAKKSAHPAESGEIQLIVGGKTIASRRFTEQDVEVIGLDIDKPEAIFKLGEKTDVEIVTDAKHAYPFALTYTYTSLTPLSAEKCAVRIETKLGRNEANEGDTVPLAVSLENKLKKGHGMAVAVIGIPAGMKVPTDMKQLTDLREKGVISYFETRGRELVLYWRDLAPEQKIALSVDLICDVPGTYRGPASRAYLYYDADHKHWVEPLSIRIAPMETGGGAATK